jgi:hypothetical protein
VVVVLFALFAGAAHSRDGDQSFQTMVITNSS